MVATAVYMDAAEKEALLNKLIAVESSTYIKKEERIA
jgi:hypothetical protein